MEASGVALKAGQRWPYLADDELNPKKDGEKGAGDKVKKDESKK